MKNKFAALIIATFVATPVMAQNFENQVFANQNVKAVELSQAEMKETQGAVAPMVIGAAFGAGASGITYAYGAWQGDYKWDTKKFAGNVATGAVIGGLTSGAGAIASNGAKFIPSLTNAGANVWRANSIIANYGVNKIFRNDR
ncbi:hypothetical protein V6667_02935 [Neisseria leonii]|uniref:Integral membrane protein n=1 Tax=Neisseria leonii TaxID=2995413 RepID=A0A9X4E7V2_9NEIS|nr:hypothetical protein [Neisseria sp. 51.81]MDD9327188.1 hypothetical protein [Neisseria sp. 51.81]